MQSGPVPPTKSSHEHSAASIQSQFIFKRSALGSSPRQGAGHTPVFSAAKRVFHRRLAPGHSGNYIFLFRFDSLPCMIDIHNVCAQVSRMQ